MTNFTSWRRDHTKSSFLLVRELEIAERDASQIVEEMSRLHDADHDAAQIAAPTGATIYNVAWKPPEELSDALYSVGQKAHGLASALRAILRPLRERQETQRRLERAARSELYKLFWTSSIRRHGPTRAISDPICHLVDTLVLAPSAP